MTDEGIYQFLLAADGVNQSGRSPLALDPANVRVDPRTKRDILRFLHALSAEIRFFDLNDQPQGDWRPFLEMLSAGDDILDEVQLDSLLLARQDWPPHLALLMSFLRVFSYAQQDLNRLPTRRLNFYYQDVLRVRRRPAVADKVHTVFELARNAAPTLLKSGTLLKAGTTKDGVPLNYALDHDHVVGHARVATLMSSLADQDHSGRRAVFRTVDATAVRSSGAGWRPFGAPQLHHSDPSQPMEPVSLGCAIASPNLFLGEGRRTVTVRLRLRSRVALPPTGLNLRNAIDVRMTGESGWIGPDAVLEALLVEEPTEDPEAKELRSTLTISALYNEGAPAITAFDAALHAPSVPTRWPVWSMTVRAESFLTDLLGGFTVSEVEISVDVRGLRDLVLQNDQSLQSPDAPVLPFGGFPRIGGNFYIGSAEAFRKSVTSLAVNLEWQDPPANLSDHYSDYENPNVHNARFRGDLYLLGGRTWQKLTATQQTLFNGDARTPKTIAIGPAVLAQQTAYSSYRRQPDLAPAAAFSHGVSQGFLRLELTGPTRTEVGNLPADAPFEAFGHKSFQPIYARHALQIAQGDNSVALPQPPYTPTLAAVSVDYTAGEVFRIDQPNGIEQFFMLDVFGAAETEKAGVATLVARHPQQAALYVGIEKAAPPQLLSLLFQFEEGSAPGADLLEADEISWSYLAADRWQPIARTDVLEDRTAGFQTPGLVRLVLGPDATARHTLMPPGLHWLRASVMSKADGAASLQDLLAQGARATLSIRTAGESSFDDHLSAPLPVGSVSALVSRIAAIKKVEQPYPSFGGRPAESDADYHRRVHERLRHRSRGVTRWDYERLVLEAFPGIFKVKCLPHTDPGNQLAPGEVRLVIVPDWRQRSTGDPLKPRANSTFLRTVEEFVAESHTSTFTTVRASNPVYEPLLVDSQVRFRSGFDPGFHAARLEEEIKRFLSPWAYEEGRDIVFGGKIHASEILAFIEGREYVDVVTDFELYHQHRGDPGGGVGQMQIGSDFIVGLTPAPTVGPSGGVIGENFVIGIPSDTAVATRPDAILVSAGHHRIGVLSAEGKACEGTSTIGIGQMVLGLDFVVVT